MGKFVVVIGTQWGDEGKGKVVDLLMERAAAVSPVRVWPIGAASMGSKGEALAEIAAMKQAGIVAVSDAPTDATCA